LVPDTLYGNTRYSDPIESASREADILRHDEKCDLVICLSHLGYKYEKKSELFISPRTADPLTSFLAGIRIRLWISRITSAIRKASTS
jgi:hypothetical protein